MKDMSARPLVVGAAAAVFCYASSHRTQAVRGLYNSHCDLEANSRPIANALPLPKREGFLGFKMGKNREGL